MPDAPRLMLVTDATRARLPLPALVAAAVAGGVDAVQLRAPALMPDARAALAGALRAAVGERARLLINGDWALAARIGVGVHLPEAGPTPTAVRARLGADVLIGRSVHSPHAAAAAASDDADYLIAGHVFPTVSKPGRPPLGPAGLAAIVAATSRPVLAIGGITRATAGAALAAGASGLAVIGAISEADDPAAAAHALRALIEQPPAEAKEQTMTETITSAPVDVTINGKPVSVPVGSTLASFITGKGFTAEMVIIELNGAIIPRPAYPRTAIRAGDTLEVVHAVGGG